MRTGLVGGGTLLAAFGVIEAKVADPRPRGLADARLLGWGRLRGSGDLVGRGLAAGPSPAVTGTQFP